MIGGAILYYAGLSLIVGGAMGLVGILFFDHPTDRRKEEEMPENGVLIKKPRLRR